MATLLLRRPLFTALTLSSAALATPLLLQPHFQSSRLLCDSPISSYQSSARAPVVKRGRLNPSAVKQISSGSILGLVCGLGVSLFSKPLALLIGLLVFGVQALESRGIHLIPYGRLQRYFTSINLRSAIQDNVAFKLSFGATFALSAFAEL
ncbi:hypothetical protein M501DRAFT_970023 [Patellaria atrata CBS 101060]|uniref:FUN14 family protein n=1 Tax=Patellaria atrata CBS 101060 TaxID=1346257 RepID=A0A9P4SFC2_9PEZI|nr:hypothetical protein M501DRAFT_970023 [Patellaria atrata CBS 101060]